MAAALLRLLALFALVLMPIGMGLSPAAAATHDATAASAMDEHCGRAQQHDDLGKAGPAMHCSGCAALPAELPANSLAAAHNGAAHQVPAVRQLLGTELEIATPPPKRA